MSMKTNNEKSTKNHKCSTVIMTLIAFACIAFCIILIKVILPNQKLNKAMGLLDSGDYNAAYALLEDVWSSDEIASSKYDMVLALIDSGDYETAYNLLDGLEYKDSADKRKLIQESDVWIRICPVGSTYVFGSYEQDNNISNGKEGIEWLVLAKKENRALIISRYALDCQKYNTSYTSTTWGKCSLRKWLNETFLESAFSEDEQSLILSTIVPSDKNQSSETSDNNNSTDKVFLLSIGEANEYFDSNESRQCIPTDYAIAQGAYTSLNYSAEGKTTCWWWLRSTGYYSYHAAYVYTGGSVTNNGYDVDGNGYAVRPALWISF